MHVVVFGLIDLWVVTVTVVLSMHRRSHSKIAGGSATPPKSGDCTVYSAAACFLLQPLNSGVSAGGVHEGNAFFVLH